MSDETRDKWTYYELDREAATAALRAFGELVRPTKPMHSPGPARSAGPARSLGPAPSAGPVRSSEPGEPR